MREKGNETDLLDVVAGAARGDRAFGRKTIVSYEIEKPGPYKNIPKRYRHFGMTESAAGEWLASRRPPDVIFLTSAMTYWYPGVEWAVRVLNSALPGVPVILGGLYARLCAEHARKTGADFVVAEHWEPDVTRPAMDLYGRPPYGVTMTSFGCSLSCDYCASRRLWPDYRRRELRGVLDEIDFQIGLGVKDIAFYDDALLIDKKGYFYPLCEELRSRHGENLRFHTPNGLHVREIDDSCADILKGTGFQTIRLSLESIDPRVMNAGSGKVARDQYAAAVKNLLRAGYGAGELETYILLGLPNQSVGSVKETISFVRECGGKPKLAEFSPIPGTPAFARAAAKIPRLLSEPLLHNNSVYSAWISGEMSAEELQELKDFAK